ncbi:SinI family restriction endonuclease [Nitrincola sp. MINF-07-Sa-05]|uniref:SinI family restriction endonuclease n=1 Tax=Nitrincola salilacus TaxID=3400273 RepID=UPI0039181F08
MNQINPSLVEQYVGIINFLASHPAAASGMRGKNAPSLGSVDYISRQAHNFAASRNPRVPKPPETVPDEMVSVILVSYFDIDKADVERIKWEHALSMGAENLIGDLLERYLASVMEPKGWLWCSGALVKAVDFIEPPSTSGEPWRLLQVKNRDNSENSSSSAIRLGTTIEKWHRTFSRRVGSNWEAFPDVSLRKELSESAFKKYVKDYLGGLK